jgi:hypothetical protein
MHLVSEPGNVPGDVDEAPIYEAMAAATAMPAELPIINHLGTRDRIQQSAEIDLPAAFSVSPHARE